jgi:cyclopropane-fatty-acyl-phospholipid synthase
MLDPALTPHATPCVGADSAAIRAHYDVSDDFFALFLDKSRAYSCALYETGDETLEAAQRAKFDWHLRAVALRPKQRLLDIGCGWGGLLERAVTRYDADRAVGLTLSAAQDAYIATAFADPAIEVRLEHWADHRPDAAYDGIVSIGAFEHFAATHLTRAERIAAYRTFFERCASWLAPGGRLSLQTIAYPETFDRAAYDASWFGSFVRERIFPRSDLPTLSEILEAADDVFEPIAIRNDRRDYARTTRDWLDRLKARRPEAAALIGTDRVEDFLRYFRLSVGCFELGNLLLLRVVFTRRARVGLGGRA